jgi:hypothetical protein
MGVNLATTEVRIVQEARPAPDPSNLYVYHVKGGKVESTRSDHHPPYRTNHIPHSCFSPRPQDFSDIRDICGMLFDARHGILVIICGLMSLKREMLPNASKMESTPARRALRRD